MIDDTKDLSLGDNVDGTTSQTFGKQYMQYVFITRSMLVEGDKKHVRKSRIGE